MADICWSFWPLTSPEHWFHWFQDEETQESVAMKKIENAFEHITCLGAQ